MTYAELTIGHWYQARFEFKEQDRITDIIPSATRANERNKSHRVVILTKFTNPEDPDDGSATCLFLTSFGNRLDLSDSIPNSRNRLKYIAVNSTPPPTTPYSVIPISVRNLRGYVNFVSEYELPVSSGDKAIVRMSEAGKGGADIHSPDWVIPYIRKLKVAWVDWMLQGAILDKWQGIVTTINSECGQPTENGSSSASTIRQGETKRLRNEEDGEYDEVAGKGKGPDKRPRNTSRCIDGADNFDTDSVNPTNCERPDDNAGTRYNGDREELGGGAGAIGNDGGIQVINCDGEWRTEDNARVLVKIEKDSEGVQLPIYERLTHPILLRAEFHELDGDEVDIEEEVDFLLLDQLFRPYPEC